MKDDFETKRILNFVSVVNEQNELINIKNAFLNDYYFINKKNFK
jgi:hypothetical protein